MPFSGGEGTRDNPYLISTPADLNNIRNYIQEGNDLFFEQTNDIDLGVYSNWQPIPENRYDDMKFMYRGNNHKITNLTIDRPEENGVALFSTVKVGPDSGAYFKIYDLVIENANIVGQDVVAGFIGSTDQRQGDTGDVTLLRCMIKDSVIEGRVRVEERYNDYLDRVEYFAYGGGAIAGLIGYGDTNTRIFDCVSANNTIKGLLTVGGAVGKWRGSHIDNVASYKNTIIIDTSYMREVGAEDGYFGNYNPEYIGTLIGSFRCWWQSDNLIESDNNIINYEQAAIGYYSSYESYYEPDKENCFYELGATIDKYDIFTGVTYEQMHYPLDEELFKKPKWYMGYFEEWIADESILSGLPIPIGLLWAFWPKITFEITDGTEHQPYSMVRPGNSINNIYMEYRSFYMLNEYIIDAHIDENVYVFKPGTYKVLFGAEGYMPIEKTITVPYFDSTVTISCENNGKPNKIIGNSKDLFNVRFGVLEDYSLKADINLQKDPQIISPLLKKYKCFDDYTQSNNNFKQIRTFYMGTSGNINYTGIFDGKGHIISNMYSSNKGKEFYDEEGNEIYYDYNTGLFEEIEGTIKNLFIKDAKLENYNPELYVSMGILAETIRGNVVIENVHIINGYIYYLPECEIWDIGLLVGYNLTKRYQDETGDWHYPAAFIIEECSVTGEIIGGSEMGGIIGWTLTSSGSEKGIIKNCYSRVKITGYGYLGGIVGYDDGVKFINCYTVSEINSEWDSGAFAGYSEQPTGSNCYFNEDVSGYGTDPIAIPRLTQEMKMYSNFDLNKFRTENDEFDFNRGELKKVFVKDNTLQLMKNIPDYNLCPVSTNYTGVSWFSEIKIINQNGDVLLNAQYDTYSQTGHRDNTSTVLEVSAGDILDITLTNGSNYNQTMSMGANFNGTLETIMDIAYTSGTHTFQWTVPANQGIFALSFWVEYGSDYVSGCGNYSYIERQDFSLAIDTEVGLSSAGYRKSTPIYFGEANEIYSSLIEWDANDNGQTVIIETSVDEGQSWQLAQNGHPIPNITAGCSSVIVKQTLTTDDITVTPALNSIYYEVQANVNPKPTYTDWDFVNFWEQDANENNGYPILYDLPWNVITISNGELKILEELTGLEGSSDTWANLSKTSIGFALPWEIVCNFGFDISREYPIVRTDRAKRSEDGGQMDAGGTVIDIGPYAQELEEGKVKGFVQYRPDYMPDFGDFRAYQTDYVLLPQYKPNLPLTELTDDISSSQISFDVVDGTQIPAGPGNLVIKESKYKFEIISYDSVTGNTVEGVIRGGFETRARNFYAGTILMEYKILEETLTWINNAWPLDPQRPYSYRAAIEIDTENNEGYQTFKFYGDAQMVEGNTKIDFSGLDRAERFIDGRDLDTLDELIDRGKFKIGEEIWEGWNDEEFKNWVWEEISGWDNNFQIGSLTEKELKSLIINLSSYTLDDLEGLTISELENLLKDILDTVSEAQIDTLYKNADTYLSSDIDEKQLIIGVEDSSKLEVPPARAVIKITEDHREIIEYESVSSNDLTDVLRGDPSFSFPAGTGVWKYGTDYNYLDELLRFLMPQPKGAFSDWTEEELKNFIKFLLLDDYDWNFEVDFPFYKWEDDIKAVLNVNIKDNTSIELEYNEEGPYKYMKDFKLGDVIVAEYEGEFRALVRIIEVKEEESGEGGRRYTLTLGRNFENLLSKINKNGDEVSRRL